MLSVEDIKSLIADTLYYESIISKPIYLKCSKPKYIQDLPGDLRSTDSDELYTRMNDIESELDKRSEILSKAEYRIGVKTRDSERLSKRIEKQMSNMDKVVTNINNESDKIVKNISALEDKLKKIDFEDKDLKKEVDSLVNTFKKKHNTLFEKDLTGENVRQYSKNASELRTAGTNLYNILQQLYNDKLINKSDLNKADISKVVNRIDKNIDKFITEGQKITKDVEGISDNQRDIDYITHEVSNVSKEMDILMDEFESTYNKYVDVTATPKKIKTPNPQMMLDIDAKSGDNFTLLPTDYDKYMV